MTATSTIERGNSMKKVLTAAVAALTIATTIAASTASADAKGFKWGGGGWGWKKHYWGYGIAAGVLTAAAIGAYAACDRVPVYNRLGEFVGFRSACDYY
jgi:hypothetical protein